MLFNFHVFFSFPIFLLLLSSGFTLLWSEKDSDTTSVFLTFLDVFWGPNRRSTLEKVLCVLEKAFILLPLDGPSVSVRPIQSTSLLPFSVFLWILGVDTVTITDREALRSPVLIVLLSSSPFILAMFALSC